GRLQPLVDANVTAIVQPDPGLFEPDARGVWNSSCRDQDVAAVDLALARGRAQRNSNVVTGSAVYANYLGRHCEFDPLFTQNPQHFISNVRILTAHQLRSGFDHRHTAPEAPISLSQFETDIAAAEHDEMRGQIIELERLDMRQGPRCFEARNV